MSETKELTLDTITIGDVEIGGTAVATIEHEPQLAEQPEALPALDVDIQIEQGLVAGGYAQLVRLLSKSIAQYLKALPRAADVEAARLNRRYDELRATIPADATEQQLRAWDREAWAIAHMSKIERLRVVPSWQRRTDHRRYRRDGSVRSTR